MPPGAAPSDRNQEATVFVGNLDDNVTEDLLWELMVQAAPVMSVHMPRDRISQTHQGFAFVEFQSEADAEYAIHLMNLLKLFGKPLRVNRAMADRKGTDIGAALFIGNLHPDVDERTLYNTFVTFGPILTGPAVMRDEAGASKGHAFLSFDSFEAADAAIATMDGQFMANQPLRVTFALKKDGSGERHGDEIERKLAAEARARHQAVAGLSGTGSFGPA